MVIRISKIDDDIAKLCAHTLEIWNNNYIEELTNYFLIGTRNLKNITLKKCKTIGDWAFQECLELETLNLPNIETIGEGINALVPSIKEINIGNKIQIIHQNAFHNELSTADHCTITIDLPENAIVGAPWGHQNAIVIWTGTQANQAPRRLMKSAPKSQTESRPKPESTQVFTYEEVENDTRKTNS